ncbi:MAG: CopG family ribbon-helix-helix protein [Candidatus Brockarchaeota archaeon]|nr:CopG family ribbon-helix-helix protein [Candidatus Brockarchaeota archaeon]
MASRIVRTSITLPKDLVRELDKFVESTRSDRSKIIHQAIRNFLSTPYKEDDIVAGSLMIVYDHDEHGLEEELTDVQHRFISLIVSNLHIHLDQHKCMLTIFVRGDFKNIQNMMNRITGKRGILMVKESLVKIQEIC